MITPEAAAAADRMEALQEETHRLGVLLVQTSPRRYMVVVPGCVTTYGRDEQSPHYGWTRGEIIGQRLDFQGALALISEYVLDQRSRIADREAAAIQGNPSSEGVDRGE